ncbi:MAG: hypothetical protein ABIJ21_04520 [Nanoarchaeota archaeon]
MAHLNAENLAKLVHMVERWQFTPYERDKPIRREGTLQGTVKGVDIQATYQHMTWFGEPEIKDTWTIEARLNDTLLGSEEHSLYWRHGKEPFGDLPAEPEIKGDPIIRVAYQNSFDNYSCNKHFNVRADFEHARKLLKGHNLPPEWYQESDIRVKTTQS